MRYLVCAALSLSCYGEGRPPHLPDGWAFIHEEGIDTAAGAYHDRVTGVFVRTEADYFGQVLAPWAESEARKRGLQTTRQPKRHLIVSRVGWPLRESAGCEEQVISILCPAKPDASWNISVRTCTDLQRKRFEELAEGLVSSDWPRVGKPPRLLTAADLSLVSDGDTWDRVRDVLGHADEANATDKGGFVLTYEAAGGLVELEFSRDQKLIRKARR